MSRQQKFWYSMWDNFEQEIGVPRGSIMSWSDTLFSIETNSLDRFLRDDMHGMQFICWRILIDWKVFYSVSVLFQPYNGGHYQSKVISFEILKFPCRSLRVYSSPKSSKTVEWVAIFDRGNHLTSHPTDVKISVKYENVKV